MSQSIEQIVADLNEIVAPGRITLLQGAGTEVSPRVVRVRYETVETPDCDTCVITPDVLQEFLEESLQVHGIQTDEVVVEAAA